MRVLRTYKPKPGAADEVLIADSMKELVTPPRRGNPAVSDSSGQYRTDRFLGLEPEPKKKGKKKASGSWEVDPSHMSIYGGMESLLVRTALIRAPNFHGQTFQVQGPESIIARCEFLRHADQEHMVVFAMDSSSRCVAIYEAVKGSVSAANVELRDIAKVLILSGTRRGIIVHNHPTGRGQPSEADNQATRGLVRGLRCMGLDLLDHIIVGADREYDYSYHASSDILD